MKQHHFVASYFQAQESLGQVSKMVVAVKLPTGATELIINTDLIQSKFDYYRNAYDDEMCLKTNPEVKIIDCLFA